MVAPRKILKKAADKPMTGFCTAQRMLTGHDAAPAKPKIPGARKIDPAAGAAAVIVEKIVKRARKPIEPVPHDPDRMYPFDAPGMPFLGPDLLRMAIRMGSAVTTSGKGKSYTIENADHILLNLVHDILRSRGTFRFPLTVNATRTESLPVVTGHVWGGETVTGPRPTSVMVIGKMLGMDEAAAGRNLVGPTGEMLVDCCRELGLDDFPRWYVTNLMKTEHPNARSGDSVLKAAWIKEWLPFLHQELKIVRPKYILCMGADALKALLGKSATIGGMDGRVVEYVYPVGETAEDRTVHTALVMACTHPAAVLRQPELEDALKGELSRFGQLIRGFRPDEPEDDIDHRVINTIEELRALRLEIERDITDNLLGTDAEWNGDHPQDEGAYIRTIQVSWKHKSAAVIRIHHPGGAWRFGGTKAELLTELRAIYNGRRVAGHFLATDMEWLCHFGLDLRENWMVADTWQETFRQALRKQNQRGGFDTALSAHSINETDALSLTAQLLKHGVTPRYDVALIKWRDEYCRKNKINKKDMEGYGECPDEILDPYGAYDADGVRRLVYVLQRLLTKDKFNNCCWEPFWMQMRAQPALLEINRTGLMVDRQKVDDLTNVYMTARGELLQQLRDWAKWPELNLASHFQVRELLFGEELNGRPHDLKTGKPQRLRPRGAMTLRLEPIMSTDKRPMLWPDVVNRGLIKEKTASTNKTALALLAQENQQVVRYCKKTDAPAMFDLSKYVNWIRDYRFISQVLKSVLRDPDQTEDGTGYETDEDGYYEYSAGLASKICGDGRVRTRMWPTKETGRWSSSSPPLQNLGKRREKDYERILGKRYRDPLRSIICARPGHFLVEADYMGAELFGMALMSGDEKMLDHCFRSFLPEDDPNYYDIHSNIAVMAFRLNCAPTKDGLISIGKENLRIAAKAVVFGVAYGRMAKAIALAVKEEKVYISIDEAQAIIDAVFTMYPGLLPYFAACQNRAINERWLMNGFGRLRRFSVARDRMTEGDLQRQAMNFPIQSLVADAVNRALDHLYQYRRNNDIDFKFGLQIHDAILLEVPAAHVLKTQAMLEECMTDRVAIYRTGLDGRVLSDEPYRMRVETAIYKAWGQTPTAGDFLVEGLDPAAIGWKLDEALGGYVHKKFKGKVWVGGAGGSLQALAA